jgi:hypothetical protein
VFLAVSRNLNGWLKVKTGATYTINDNCYVRDTHDLIVEVDGHIIVIDVLWSYQQSTGVVTNAGIIDGPGRLNFQLGDTVSIGPGDYRVGSTFFESGSYVLEAGVSDFQFNDIEFRTSAVDDVLIDMTADPTIITTGDVRILTTSALTVTIDRSGTANDWSITGDFYDDATSLGTIVYTKGNGTLTFNGSGAQSFDVDGGPVENVVVYKSAETLTLAVPLDCDSFTATAGTLDFNGQTLTTTDDFTINAANGTDVDIIAGSDAMNGVDITVGNNFYVSNVTFNATSVWYLDVQGTGAVAYDVDVKYSDATAGTTIDATDLSNKDLGFVYNWDFGITPIQSLSLYCFAWTRMTNRGRGFRRS